MSNRSDGGMGWRIGDQGGRRLLSGHMAVWGFSIEVAAGRAAGPKVWEEDAHCVLRVLPLQRRRVMTNASKNVAKWRGSRQPLMPLVGARAKEQPGRINWGKVMEHVRQLRPDLPGFNQQHLMSH